MKRFIHLLLIFCVISSIPNYSLTNAQSQFQLSIGGGYYREQNSIVETSDGGYAAVGLTSFYGAGNYDMLFVKVDRFGSLIWSKTVGNSGTWESARCIRQTVDGELIAIGSTPPGAGNGDVYIVKLDRYGMLKWSKTVGTVENTEHGFNMVLTRDGGFIIVGQSGFGFSINIFVTKFDSNDELQWSKIIGGGGFNFGYSIVQTVDGGFALIGDTSDFGMGHTDFLIVKLDDNGNMQWSRTVGGAGYDYPKSIIQTSDSGFAIAGYSNSLLAGNDDVYVVKLTVTGMLQWTRTIGGTSMDRAFSIIQMNDGNYMIAGFTSSFGLGGYDVYVVKLNNSGILQWSRTVGGKETDEAECIISTSDRGFAISGYTYSFGPGNSRLYIIKLDSNGNTCANSTSPSSLSNSVGAVNGTKSICNIFEFNC